MDSNFLFKAVMILVPMILSLTVHEYSHALAAKLLGDDTAKAQGRLTLNPVAHIDIFGTILLPLLSIGTGMPFFGWAKPVPTNPFLYTHKVSQKTGYMLVSIAGPISNFLFAIVSLIVMKLTFVFNLNLSPQLYQVILTFVFVNFGLGFFNLLPIPPLDGSKILMWLLPNHIAEKLERNSMVFFVILIALVFTDSIKYISYPIMKSLIFVVELFNMLPEFITVARYMGN